MGYPTINLDIPTIFDLESGVYAAEVIIKEQKYLSLLYYGASPTFGDEQKTMEIYLIDLKDHMAPETVDQIIKVKILKHLRPIIKFEKVQELIKQIEEDIKNARICNNK